MPTMHARLLNAILFHSSAPLGGGVGLVLARGAGDKRAVSTGPVRCLRGGGYLLFVQLAERELRGRGGGGGGVRANGTRCVRMGVVPLASAVGATHWSVLDTTPRQPTHALVLAVLRVLARTRFGTTSEVERIAPTKTCDISD